MISVYFHLYAAGAWQKPTREFLDAMLESGLADEAGYLNLGVVGPLGARLDAIDYCRSRMPTEVIAEANEGWEQVTLSALRQDAKGDAILYAHSKGAAFPSDWNDAWRRSLILSVVSEWRENLAMLETYDAVGCHWLTTAMTQPGMPQKFNFFGGNFWLARISVIRALPEPPVVLRFDAEAWLGMAGLTNVADRTPGWPGYASIRQEVRG